MMGSPAFTGIDKKTNILHGGPDPANYDDGCPSLGELFIKRLTQHGEKILLVIISISHPFFCNNIYYILLIISHVNHKRSMA